MQIKRVKVTKADQQSYWYAGKVDTKPTNKFLSDKGNHMKPLVIYHADGMLRVSKQTSKR